MQDARIRLIVWRTPVTATFHDAASTEQHAHPNLSPREIEVLLGWLRTDSKVAVADSMYLSVGTVNTHLTRIRAKYAMVGRAAPTKAALVARALQDRLITIDEL